MFPLCDTLTYKCPFCKTEAIKEYEEINSIVLAKRFKEYMKDCYTQNEHYEELIKKLENDLEHQNKIKEELIKEINELKVKNTEINVEENEKPVDYDTDEIYDLCYE
jgi:hypothetical protein